MPRVKKVKLSEEQLERCPYLRNQKKSLPIWEEFWDKILGHRGQRIILKILDNGEVIRCQD